MRSVARKRARALRSCAGDSGCGLRERVVAKRRKIGRARGTRSSWQAGVLRIVVKTWRMQACRSAFMMDGKTSDAEARAVSDRITRGTLSLEKAVGAARD